MGTPSENVSLLISSQERRLSPHQTDVKLARQPMSKTPHIVVVGSANIDLTTFTDETPRPGETIFGREFHLGFGGRGANQAVAARLCRADVSMGRRVGAALFRSSTTANFHA